MCSVFVPIFIPHVCCISILGCEDCGNEMLTKFHPGVYGLTAKNHWSCCGSAREAGGCSMCQQPSKSKSADETDSPKSKPSLESKPSITTVTSTPIIPKDTSTPEPQIMYINPLVESHTPTTDTTKVELLSIMLYIDMYMLVLPGPTICLIWLSCE